MLSEEIQIQIDSHKKEFKKYEKFIKENNWVEDRFPQINYETEKLLADSTIMVLAKFCEENKDFVKVPEVKRFVQNGLKVIDYHVDRVENYLELNDWTADMGREDIYELTERLMEFEAELEHESNDETKKELRKEISEINKAILLLEKRKKEEIEFQAKAHNGKVVLLSKKAKLNLEGDKDKKSADSMFFNKAKAPLLMRSFLSKVIPDVKSFDNGIGINWDNPNPSTSTELFINMKPKDIPEYDLSKHYWEQEKDVLQFWGEELIKLKKGINLNGYKMSPYMYWTMNFYKIALGSGADREIKNIDIRDNEYLFDYMLTKAEEDGRCGLLMYGTRRWSKSVNLASKLVYSLLTIENCQGSVQGFSGSDLGQLVTYMNESFSTLPNALRVNLIKNNDKGFEAGIKRTAQDSYTYGSLNFLNLEAGSKSGSQKTAGGTPSVSVFDEIGKGPIQKAWGAALPSFEGGKNGKWRTTPLLAGTAGEGELSKDAEEMLQDPKTFSLMLMDWDKLESMAGESNRTWNRRPFSFFLPAQMNLSVPKIKTNFAEYVGVENEELAKIPFYKTDWEKAKKHFETERENKKRNQKALGEEIRFHPLDPEDVFLSGEKNPFDALQIKNFKAELILNDIVGGKYTMTMEEGEIFPLMSDKPVIDVYPFKGGNIDCPVVILEHPDKEPMDDLYIIGFDDAKQETSDGDSVRSAVVFKREYVLGDPFANSVVAYYDSRQDNPQDYYKQLYMLMKYYNARVFHENEDNGFVDFLEREHPSDVRFLVPSINFTDALGDSFYVNKNRRYGYSPHGGNNGHLLRRTVAYTKEDVGNGMNNGFRRLRYPMLLEEMIQYRKENNADRLRAFGLAVIFSEYLGKMYIEPRKQKTWEPHKESERKKSKLRGGFTSTKRFKKRF